MENVQVSRINGSCTMCVHKKRKSKRGNISMIGGDISVGFLDILMPWNITFLWVNLKNTVQVLFIANKR